LARIAEFGDGRALGVHRIKAALGMCLHRAVQAVGDFGENRSSGSIRDREGVAESAQVLLDVSRRLWTVHHVPVAMIAETAPEN
jgi:hypothetical protein